VAPKEPHVRHDVHDKQLAANRANAQTPPAPAPRRQIPFRPERRKHGFAGSDFAIVKIEDRDAVDRLRADLIAVYQPINSQETFALERIALASTTSSASRAWKPVSPLSPSTGPSSTSKTKTLNPLAR
jgi:hypothetical protein